MPKPADVNPSLGRMVKKAMRPDWFRWKPYPPPPPEFLRRFPEMKPYFDLVATIWSENESAIRRALESIPDPTEVSEDDLSATEEQQVREIVSGMIQAVKGSGSEPPSASGDFLTEEEIIQIINEATDTFIWNQGTPAITWQVTHNLGRYPSVMVVDSSGNWFIPEVKYINENLVEITHFAAFAGKAYLN